MKLHDSANSLHMIAQTNIKVIQKMVTQKQKLTAHLLLLFSTTGSKNKTPKTFLIKSLWMNLMCDSEEEPFVYVYVRHQH